MKKPKKLQPPKVDTRKELFVEVISNCIRSYSEGVQFGSWESEYDSSLKGVSRDRDLLNRYNIEGFCVPDEVYNSEFVYIVYVKYSTGNTFGRSSGNLAIAFITEDPDEAIEAKSAVETEWREKKWEDHPKNVSKWPVWDGYFESVEGVSIEFMPVLGAK